MVHTADNNNAPIIHFALVSNNEYKTFTACFQNGGIGVVQFTHRGEKNGSGFNALKE